MASLVLSTASWRACATLLSPATCAFSTAAWVSAGDEALSQPVMATPSEQAVRSRSDAFCIAFMSDTPDGWLGCVDDAQPARQRRCVSAHGIPQGSAVDAAG